MDEFIDGLGPILTDQVQGLDRVISVERLSGGASQETYRIETIFDGQPRRLALRRSAGGETEVAEGRPGLEIEAKLMKAAAAADVPEPEVIHVLDPGDGLGRGFLMGWIDGETLGARIVRSPELAQIRPKLAFQAGQVLGRIHQIDYAAAGLDTHLQTLSTHQFVTDTWQRYQDLNTPQPMIDYAGTWLMENLPPASVPSLVHNDFRNGNLIVGPDGIRAVLDWEAAHLGDPMRDLGWICTNSWRFGRSDLPVGGFGHYAELFAGYESVTNTDVDPDQVRFWEVFGSFWWAVGCLAMGEHYRTGPDPTVERPAIARRSSECQIDCANLIIPGPVTLVEPLDHPADGSSTDLPLNDELVSSVIGFLRDEVMANTEARINFLARVAANSLEIVRREFRSGPVHRRNETDRLHTLLGLNPRPNPTGSETELDDLRWRLVHGLRDGSIGLSHPGLADHLRDTVANQVAIDQPRYSGLRASISSTS